VSEREGESRSIGAFLLGFLTGVLVCLGAVGSLYFVQFSRSEAMARAAMEEAEAARAMAVEAEARSREEAKLALVNEQKAKQQVELFGKLTRAREGVTALDKAVAAYKVRQGNYPESLKALTQGEDGKPALIEEAALLDPWGRPYVYEPQALHPEDRRPLIYSRGPDPEKPAGAIRNWKMEKE
jgi:hypothetical protein